MFNQAGSKLRQMLQELTITDHAIQLKIESHEQLMN